MSQLYPFTDPVAAQQRAPTAIVRGQGCFVEDDTGRRYLDAVAGLWCAALGFDDARLTAAATRQYETLAYYHSFMGRTPAIANQLSERLGSLLPAPLSHLIYGCSGSDAVDTAVKLVRYYQNARGRPDKKRIVAREGAYHGSGALSAGLTAMAYCHDGFDVRDGGVLRTGRPHYYADAQPGESEVAFAKRRAKELDALIRTHDAGTIAAFIGEPAMGAGGVILPPDGYWAEIQDVLARHDILLIADETITGFGRSGEWFGCQTYGISPDLMTMAKQLSAAYFPISAVAMSAAVHQAVAQQAHRLGTFGHGFTYGGHPVGAAIALEALAIYEEMDLPAHVSRLGALLDPHLERIASHPAVGDVRRVGLLAGVELRDDTALGAEFGRRVVDEAERRGVLFRPIGNVVAISPPYTIGSDEIAFMIRVLGESLDTVAGAGAALAAVLAS